jgi:hypothetical protein
MSLSSVIQAIMPSVVALGRRSEIPKANAPQSLPIIVGTGFIVDEGGLIATSRHVLEELERWPGEHNFVALLHTAESQDGEKFSGVAFRKIIGTFWLGSFTQSGRSSPDSNPDLALAVIDVRGLPALSVRPEGQSLQPGVEVVSAGFPKGKVSLSPQRREIPSPFHPFARRGIVSSVLPYPCEEPDGFTVDISPEGAAGGSPICSVDDGTVLGVLSGGYDGTPVTYGVPGYLLASAIVSVREQWEPNPELPTLLESVQSQIGEPAVIAAAEPVKTEEQAEWDSIRRFIERDKR